MPTESQKLILLEDISGIITTSHDLPETLDHITSLLAERMAVDVCSIYLVEAADLVLRSSRGLSPSAVGAVRMSPSEGLTGFTFETGQPVNVERAAEHPRFKFFPGIGEERFHSYLGVPLIFQKQAIGVLTVQTAASRLFSADDVRLLVTAASQLSPVIAHARLLETQARRSPPRRIEARSHGTVFLRGIGASRGVGRGLACPLLEESGLEVLPEGDPASPEGELERFEEALGRSIDDVAGLRDQVSAALSEEDGAIFHAHLMMLEDRGIQEKIRNQIREGVGAAQAVSGVARDYIEAFRSLQDPYLRERAADVRDVAHRLIQHLSETQADRSTYRLSQPSVVLAQDITPSQFVQLLQPNLAGVVLAGSGPNAHTAILCRSAGIPAVVGVDLDPSTVAPGQLVILDGNAGLVYLSPPEQVREEYERLTADSSRLAAEILTHIQEPSVTRDGLAVRLLGNAALLSDLPKILEAGAEGVGLYRTEFPFLIRSTFPNEDEQLEIYRKILAALDGRPATLRTLDVGGDKTLPYLNLPRESNPHLGWRSIRLSLTMEEPFRIQIRALLRASAFGNVQIVFPMISTAGELQHARRIAEEERRALRARGVPVGAVPVGAMVEVPSAALALERLAEFADFFSLGTNDLVQYLLAVDRANRRVAHLYDPLHPVVLDVVATVAETARRLAKPLSVCGEMAGRPLGAAALLALGLDVLSLSPGGLPAIRRLIQLLDAGRLRALAPSLRGAAGAEEVRTRLRTELSAQQIPEELWSSG